MNISRPYGLQHIVHVDMDSATGFTGLPPEWEKILKTGGITKNDVVSNPEAALAVMNFVEKQTSHQCEPEAPPIVESGEVIKSENPCSFLTDMTKINEGSTCTVYTATYNGKKIAVKEMILNPKNKTILLEETKLMATMSNPNIIEFYGGYKVNQMLWILMEYMDGGSLTKHCNFL